MNQWTQPPDGSAPEPRGPFRPINLTDLSYIAHNLRAVDQEEIYNWVGYHDPSRLARDIFETISKRGRGRTVLHNRQPVAWIGVIESEPGIWEVTMGGTDELPMVAFHCMAWARWTCRETMHNGQLLYCYSRVGHDEAHQFLLALGAKCESQQLTGTDGGKYLRFYWRYGENDADVSRPDLPNGQR